MYVCMYFLYVCLYIYMYVCVCVFMYIMYTCLIIYMSRSLTSSLLLQPIWRLRERQRFSRRRAIGQGLPASSVLYDKLSVINFYIRKPFLSGAEGEDPHLQSNWDDGEGLICGSIFIYIFMMDLINIS